MNIGSADQFCGKRDLCAVDGAWDISNIAAARGFVIATSMSAGTLGEVADERHIAKRNEVWLWDWKCI